MDWVGGIDGWWVDEWVIGGFVRMDYCIVENGEY